MNFYMSKAFNDLLIIIYEVTLIQNLSGNCISFHHCFISVCTNPSSKRRLDCGKYTSFIVICWTKCSDMQHLCIALDFSPDLMFFALFFNPTLSQSFYRSANNLLYHTPIGTPSLLTSISWSFTLPSLHFLHFCSTVLFLASSSWAFWTTEVEWTLYILSAKAHELVGFISLSFILFLDRTEIYWHLFLSSAWWCALSVDI